MHVRLSMGFDDMRGSDGTLVVQKGRSGLFARPRREPRNPKTNPQRTARTRLTRAARTYKGMTSAQLTAWRNYALTLTKKNSVTGVTYSPTAINVFVGLTTKFLQVSPSGTIPMNPPTGTFAGDSITVTAAGSAGKITFTASAANAAGVKTELLLQTMKSSAREPQDNGYRTLTFVAFATGSLEYLANLGPGIYAAAYRFVETATGRQTDFIEIPVVTVSLAVEEGGAGEKRKAA